MIAIPGLQGTFSNRVRVRYRHGLDQSRPCGVGNTARYWKVDEIVERQVTLFGRTDQQTVSPVRESRSGSPLQSLLQRLGTQLCPSFQVSFVHPFQNSQWKWAVIAS